MKLTSLHIDDFRQFKDFRLDFTDPKTGKPLDKVCFIGPNGTGKSTLLKAVAQSSIFNGSPSPVFKQLEACGIRGEWTEPPAKVRHYGPAEWFGRLMQLTVFSPAEGDWDFASSSTSQPFEDMPSTSLDMALSLISEPSRGEVRHVESLGGEIEFHDPRVSYKHLVGSGTVDQFWTRLIAHLKQREQAYLAFQRLPENRDKTIAQLDAEFDAANPQVMDRLAEVWDRILRLAHLELDRESIAVPFQLTDNLKAYLRTASGGSRVHYSDLSTGIRHYLFRLGHIWSLYFNREPGDSLLLVDEPEGSLYPDFLYDIVRNYREVAPGCQLFMATHSPIVAAQFRPEERFILNFGEDGKVTARRGVSPEGDDPNDILRQDFGVGSLMTEKGQQAYDRFLKLRRLIPASQEPEKTRLIEEYRKLGSAYNFQAPASLNEGAA